MEQRSVVRIRVRGQIGPRWESWFEGFSVADVGTDETALTGPVVDQAALNGLLARIGDLGLDLISVAVGPDRADESTVEA